MLITTPSKESGQLTANDLQVRGIAAIEDALDQHAETILSVRGAPRFVVMKMAQYPYLRESELEAALAQSRADMSAESTLQESAAAHLARQEDMLSAEEDPPAK